MSNPYYTATGLPAFLTRGVSATERNEYALIQTAFDGVNTAIIARGSVAGQVWTGLQNFTGATITVPTLPYGTSGSFAVSMDTLNAAVFASAALPAQTGNAGNVLLTNGTTPNWGRTPLPRSARTANVQLVGADGATYVDITSGTFTQTFATPAVRGAGWWVRLGNSGTGFVTIPSSDGLTNWVMYPGEIRDFFCDGAADTSRIIHSYCCEFLSTVTYVKPPGYREHGYMVHSGGASGARTGAGSTAALGGYGGGSFPGVLNDAIIPATILLTVGAGGAPVTGVAAGNVGGDSSIGALVTVVGASTSFAGAVAGPGGGNALVGSVSSPSNPVGFEAAAGVGSTNGSLSALYAGTANGATSNSLGNGGTSMYGGGCGGGITSGNVVRLPGGSVHGGAGGAASVGASGVDGSFPSGGGGATQFGSQSGAGGAGKIKMWGIA